MSWIGALIDVFLGGGMSDGNDDYRGDGFSAYRQAWLSSRESGDTSLRVLTDQLDRFETFKRADGTTDYPQILIDAWQERLTPASARRLLVRY